LIKVESANEMYEAAVSLFPKCDGAVMAAAVADYTPQSVKNKKIKRENTPLILPLKSTKDIAAHLGSLKKKSQLLVGFALETHDEITRAKKKCREKNFDLIVLNSLNTPGGGFYVDTNKVTFIDKNNNLQEFELKSKEAVARDIVDKMIEMISWDHTGPD
jgi:phosphopantothenoylcysteine decarboxylase / phosphopantothenate---cysteine ligase